MAAGPLPSIRDTIHQSIPVEPFVQDLLETPQLQRLRRIRQLGGVYLVYPGANHSRFEHALGAYALGRQVAHTMDLPREDAKVVMAGALLHDVGHGPFSHTSEELLYDSGRRHEDLTVDLVRWSTIASVLDKHGISVDRVVDAVEGKGPVGPLVSGDLDVDRMDYLVRDAYHTGVRMTVDTERIASGLRMVHDEIVLHERSLAAAEALLVTRFMMYPTVYVHHTCRSIERIIVSGIRSLHDAGQLKVEDLERLDDGRLIARMRQGPEAAADAGRRIEERDLYKRVIEGRMQAAREVKGLFDLSGDPTRRRALEQAIAERAGVAPHHVLVDVPPRHFMKSVGIRVLSRSGDLMPFEQASSLATGLALATEDHWRFWVFAPREVAHKVEPAALEELGLDMNEVTSLSAFERAEPAPDPREVAADAASAVRDSLPGQTRL